MAGTHMDRSRLLVLVFACALFAGLAGMPASARAEVTIVRPEGARSWPPGTDLIPFEFRDGLILVRATLFSPSGRDTSGLLVVDTGAPELALGVSVWNALNVDTLEVTWGFVQRVRRTLTGLEMGSGRIDNLPVGGVIADSVLGPGVMGLFAPDVYEDRAVVIDYQSQQLAIVNQRLTVVAADTTAPPHGADLGRLARIRRSRSCYAGILGASAVPLPFRLFRGGRILVGAQVVEPAGRWRSQPLTLLFDTGASACAVFEDAMAERVRPPAHWPRQADVPLRTVLGSFLEDATLLPRLCLIDGSAPVEQDYVTAGVMARHSLPDIQGELPDPIHGLVGNTFLARYRIVLDYGNRILWLEPRAGRQARTTRRSQLGLHLGRVGGELRALDVEAGSPAAAAGVRPGDVVVSIDHAPVDHLEPEAAERLLQGTPGSEVVLALRRDRLQRIYRLKRGTGS
jgi:hypothetical protein